MSIAENKGRYENSALKALMDASDHQICERCYCCDLMWEHSPCWQCGGFDNEDEDGWDDECSVCGGEGDIDFQVCVGDCDDEGNHKIKPADKRSRE